MSLNSLLNDTLENKGLLAGIIHANEDNYPFVNFAIDVLKTKLATYTNYHKYTADRFFDFNAIWDILNNGSLFNDRNFIIIEYKTKPTLEHQEQITNLIERLGQDNFLLIVSDQLTKKDLSAKWVTAVSNNGFVNNVASADTRLIIKYKFKSCNINIADEAINLLAELNQANPVQLIQELNRLAITYPEGSTLDINAIQNIDNSQYNIYQLSNAYLSGDINKSLKILDNLYKTTEDAILIMWVMLEDVRKLLKLKASIKQGGSISSLIPSLRIFGEAIAAIQNANNRLSFSALINLLDQISSLDMLIKGVTNGDTRYKLIEIITLLSGRKL